MKKKLFFISLLTLTLGTFLFLISDSQVSAQTNYDEEARKRGIIFPVKELGGCGSFNECMQYCDNPSNQEKCVSFAKSKGLDAGPPPGARKMSAGGGPGGCNSEQSCKSYCDQPNNRQACMDWAKANGYASRGGPPGGVHGPEQEAILQDAQAQFGCSGGDDCARFCDNPSNSQKCSEFAKKHGLFKGEGQPGQGGPPGLDQQTGAKMMSELGCDREQCRAFCDNPANKQRCSEVAAKYGIGGGRQGGPPPGVNCNSEEECRKICEADPSKCGGNPAEHGQGRTGPGGCNSQESCEAYCRANPSACGGGPGSGPGGPPPGMENSRGDFGGRPTPGEPPVGSQYQQPPTSREVPPSYSQPPTTQSYPSREQYQQPTTQYQPSQTPTTSEQYQTPAPTEPTTTTNTTETQSVRGVKTDRTWFHSVLDFLNLPY